MRIHLHALLGASLFTLAACGGDPLDRGLSGAGIGAAGGAAGAAIVGTDPLDGAIIGGLAGGLIGALTDEHDVDLGRPVWR